MSLHERIDQSLIELGHKIYSALYPFADVYFSQTGAYWFEVILLLFSVFLFSLPYLFICKNESGFRVSLIRLFGRMFAFLGFFGALLPTAVLSYMSLFGDNRMSFLRFGHFEDVSDFISSIELYGISLGLLLLAHYVFVKKFYEPKLSAGSIKKTNRIGEDEAFTDVRELHSEKAFKSYNPKKYFEKAAKNDALFFGLDKNRKPLFVSRQRYNKTNIQVSGSMGAGKGIQAQMILSQQVLQGDAVLVFDPKLDDYLPHILKNVCEQSGKPFYFFNLRDAEPQVNPFSGANEHEVAELLIAAFDLETRNSDSDVYKISEQKSAQKIADFVVQNRLHLSQVSERINLILSEEEQKSSRGLIERIETLSRLGALKAGSTTSFDDVLKSGGVVYVIGDDVGVIKDAQKMLLVRVLQLVKNTQPNHRQFVSIFADEVKSLLCPLLVNQSGQLRSRRANLIFAHQTDADLNVIGNNYAEILKGNASLRWFYRQQSFKAAEEVANLTGFKKAQSSSYINESNGLGEEVRSGEERRSIEQKAHLFDTNVIQTLPDNTAILIGDGLAKIGFCSEILIDNSVSIPISRALPNQNVGGVMREDYRESESMAPDFLDTLHEK